MNKLNLMPLVRAFERERQWVKFQIDSFNAFIDHGIQDIVDEIKEINVVSNGDELKIKFGKVSVGKPVIKEVDGYRKNIYPNEARLRNLTYMAPVYVEVTPILNGIEERRERVKICEIPVMVKSKICNLHGLSEEELIKVKEDPTDPGGYFIINGTERVLVLIEEVASNRPIFEKNGNVVSVRINSERSGFRQKHLIEMKGDNILTISFANIRRLPLIVLLKALGMENDKEICDAISSDKRILNEFYVNLFESEVATKEEAINFMGRKLKVSEDYMEERISQVLDRYLLPHIGQEEGDRMRKANYITRIIRKCIMVKLGMIPTDDIDHFSNKRVLMAGDLLSQLMRAIFLGRWGLVAKLTYNYQKLMRRRKFTTVQSIIEADSATKQIMSAMATGAWIGGRTGVSQRLDRSSYVKTISHLRSILSPLSTTQEHFSAREIHPTEWGRICPAETPEGSSIGLREHLSLFAEVTFGIDKKEEEKILRIIKSAKASKTKEEGKAMVDVYIDGRFIDSFERKVAIKIVNDLRERRRSGLISEQVNVAFLEDYNEVRINTLNGRVRRPLVIVENGKPRLNDEVLKKLEEGKMKFSDLVREGVIEFLDAEEEENAYISPSYDMVTEEHTHVEIMPVAILGTSAALTPFPEYNRGDRVNYGAKMVGQSIGSALNNFLLRFDTNFNVLVYPQMPLVETKMDSILNEHPYGHNVVIAVLPFEGYNMNDALILNKSSVERGLFRSIYFRTYKTVKARYWGGQEDEIGIPDAGIKGYKGEDAYKNIGEDGLIAPEIRVNSDDVIIAKTSPLRFLSSGDLIMEIENKRENSVCVRHGEEGIVDKVMISETLDGEQLFKVRVREERIPEIGDKFATRHGQKGVAALLLSHEDMPFTSSGIVPDVIFNPHGIPSRMTVGQLMEILAGKYAAVKGAKIDGTAFDGAKETDIRKGLELLGFRSDGKEVMYDGRTGKRYEVEIYTGVIYYMKLDHMVKDKIQIRSRGPVTLLTKQPTEGRSKGGGLRLGEMEQQCMIGHGASMVLRERFSSDDTLLPVCEKCGLVAIYNHHKKRSYCPICRNSRIIWVNTSYAFKLMLDELKSFLIYPKLKVKEI